MARIKYPSKTQNAEKLDQLMQGFIIEADPERGIDLFLKLDAALLSRVMGGCRITMAFNVERKCPRLNLWIHDSKNGQYLELRDNPLEYEEKYTGYLNSVIFALKNNVKLTISIFDLLTAPITAYDSGYTFESTQWRSWISQRLAYDSVDVGDFFEIHIENPGALPNTLTNVIVNHIDDHGAVVDSHHYDYNNMLESGVHGYAQEHSIKAILIKLFELGENLFISPKYLETQEEFIDLVLLLPNSAILIESKFVLSKSKVNQRFKKAVMQLEKAYLAIRNDEQAVNNPILNAALKKKLHIHRMCVFNSDIDIANHYRYIQSLTSDLPLPIFASTSALFQLLGHVYSVSPSSFLTSLENVIPLGTTNTQLAILD